MIMMMMMVVMVMEDPALKISSPKSHAKDHELKRSQAKGPSQTSQTKGHKLKIGEISKVEDLKLKRS